MCYWPNIIYRTAATLYIEAAAKQNTFSPKKTRNPPKLLFLGFHNDQSFSLARNIRCRKRQWWRWRKQRTCRHAVPPFLGDTAGLTDREDVEPLKSLKSSSTYHDDQWSLIMCQRHIEITTTLIIIRHLLIKQQIPPTASAAIKAERRPDITPAAT